MSRNPKVEGRRGFLLAATAGSSAPAGETDAPFCSGVVYSAPVSVRTVANLEVAPLGIYDTDPHTGDGRLLALYNVAAETGKPPTATLRPPQSLLIAKGSRPQSHLRAASEPPQSHLNATSKPPSSHANWPKSRIDLSW